MKKGSLTVAAVILVSALAIVTAGLFLFPYEPGNPPSVNENGSTQQGIHEVVYANNQFAFDLYSELEESNEGNIFYSPYSISSALAMTYEGAKGKTADEIKSVFHFSEEDTLRSNFAAVYNQINKEDKIYELKTGNALWVQKDFPLFEDYLSIVEEYYGGKAANLDFINESERSRQTINQFIKEQTNNKIKDLIPEGGVSPMTRLVLTNAIYFKGDWEWEFDKSKTREGDFKITSDNIIQTEMMYMDSDKAKFNYANLEKIQILELPYKGNEISMLILLPKQGQEDDFKTGEEIIYNYSPKDIELSPEKLAEYKSKMQETDLDSIYLPKFEFDTKYFMMDSLSNLGMPTAFDSQNADFSGMTTAEQLFISKIIHQAYVKVDEKGTEAAAATAVGMESSSINENIFRADHPFIFLIQEKSTGSILFLGKVVDPTQ